jgi:hypothetical protein
MKAKRCSHYDTQELRGSTYADVQNASRVCRAKRCRVLAQLKSVVGRVRGGAGADGCCLRARPVSNSAVDVLAKVQLLACSSAVDSTPV